jgi:hypothetical protein
LIKTFNGTHSRNNKKKRYTLFCGILGTVLLRMKASPTRIAHLATTATKTGSIVF